MLNTGGSHRTANSTPHQLRGTSSGSAGLLVPANADELQQHLLYVVCTCACDHLLLSSVEPSCEFLADLES